MATVIRAEIPAEEFALYETFQSIPEVSFECERIVKGGDQIVMPLVWAYGFESDRLNEVLEEDPSVADASLLAEFEDELLYRMEWIDQVRLVLQMMTNSQATVLSCYGDTETWILRVLFPTRDSLSHTHEFCNDHGLTFEVHYVREMDGEPAGRWGLTVEQYEALTTASERGYFQVPREIDLQDLANDIGVSHQALSERLRRGHDVLIQEALMVGPPPRNEDQ